MTAYILALSDSNATIENVGGKGMSLAKMANAALPVPDGFHITTDAYRRFVAENEIGDRIAGALVGLDPADAAALESASRQIGDLFAAGMTPPEIVEAVAAAYARLKDAPVAVRSSATAEDLPDASFAGQQETYLNIRGEEAVLDAVKKCWASLWTGRAIAYRMKNGIDQDVVALAVVVQELVFADAAGILFTANPINGQRGELVINAAWGLGEAVVSGAVTPDTITVEKATGKIVGREIAEKAIMTVRTEQGVEEKAVPAELQKKPALSDAQIAELTRLAVQIEQFYERPMDIEWTLADDRVAIVQARPITVLPEPPLVWERPDPDAIYARGSLAEHIPSPVTPLFATLGLEIANQATAQMWQRMIGKDASRLVARGGFYQALNGYVYGGIRMKPKDMWTVSKMTLSQISPIFRGSVARWQAARQELAAVVEAWEQREAALLSASQLLEAAMAVYGAACYYFTIIQTTLPAASSSEVMFARFYKSLVRGKEDPEATVFLLGFDTAALQAEKSLFDLASWVKEHSVLAEYIREMSTDKLLAGLSEANLPDGAPSDLWSELRLRFQRHLDDLGRTTYEFDFAWPTPAETPAPLLDAIKAYLDGKASNPYERQNESVARREQATQAVLSRLGWPRKGWFQKLLRWAQETAPMRENSIYDMGMGHLLIRRFLGELGSRFAAGGAIQAPEDIYWLEKPEVEELVIALEADLPLPSFAERVPERKAQWEAYLKASPPVMLPEKSGWSKFVHGAESETKDGKLVLKGVGTSSGVVTAPARVLFGPEDFGKLKPGDVLVAVTTTPAWTPLFAVAAAVVTDIGGPLSHSSIVAREYGIPAVMAARGATRIIQNGQMVQVDGIAGTVTLEE